eukprot:2362876-Pyramimonas_sp.AAC.1
MTPEELNKEMELRAVASRSAILQVGYLHRSHTPLYRPHSPLYRPQVLTCLARQMERFHRTLQQKSYGWLLYTKPLFQMCACTLTVAGTITRPLTAMYATAQVTYGSLTGMTTGVFKLNRTGNLLFSKSGFLFNAQQAELDAACAEEEPLFMNTQVWTSHLSLGPCGVSSDHPMYNTL